MMPLMLSNGNMLIPKRAEGSHGTIGDGMIEVSPHDPDYIAWNKWAEDTGTILPSEETKEELIEDILTGVQNVYIFNCRDPLHPGPCAKPKAPKAPKVVKAKTEPKPKVIKPKKEPKPKIIKPKVVKPKAEPKPKVAKAPAKPRASRVKPATGLPTSTKAPASPPKAETVPTVQPAPGTIAHKIMNDPHGDKQVSAMLESGRASYNLKVEAYQHYQTASQLSNKALAGIPLTPDEVKLHKAHTEAYTAKTAQARVIDQTALHEVMKVKEPGTISIYPGGYVDENTKVGIKDAKQWLRGKVEARLLKGYEDLPVHNIRSDQEQRSHYIDYMDKPGVAFGKGAEPAIMVHEWGHHLHTNPEVAKAAHEFLEHRLKGSDDMKLADLFPDSKFGASEIGNADKFGNIWGDKNGTPSSNAYYAGKKYKNGQTEIVSMAVEMLHRDPVRLAHKDPELFKFITGVMDGRHLKPSAIHNEQGLLCGNCLHPLHPGPCAEEKKATPVKTDMPKPGEVGSTIILYHGKGRWQYNGISIRVGGWNPVIGETDEKSITETHHTIRKLLGTDDVQIEHIPKIVGAPPGSTINVHGSHNQLRISVYGPNGSYVAHRSVHRDANGSLVMHNDSFFMDKKHQGKGDGTKIFSDQVKACKGIGFDKIETMGGRSARGMKMNGYYTWPRLGYDGPIAGKLSKKLPPELAHCNTVQDLYKTKEGRDFWKTNGKGIDLTFDLKEGSHSLAILNAYHEEKKKLKGESTTNLGTDTMLSDDDNNDSDTNNERGDVPDLSPEDEKALDRLWAAQDANQSNNDRTGGI